MASRLNLTTVRVVHDSRVFLVRFKDGDWYDIRERMIGIGPYGSTFVYNQSRLHSNSNSLGRFLYLTVVNKAKEKLNSN